MQMEQFKQKTDAKQSEKKKDSKGTTVARFCGELKALKWCDNVVNIPQRYCD